MPFCNGCGTEVADAKFCPKCGAPVGAAGSPAAGPSAAPPPNSPPGSTGGAAANDDNLMGALAYVTVIPAIIFLIIEPYKNRRFVRFHAFQCLFLFVAAFALGIGVTIISMVPVIGWIIAIFSPFVFLGVFVLAIIAAIKAYQGLEYRLPIIGEMAAKQV